MESKALLDELLELILTVSRVNRNMVQMEGRGRLGHLSAIQMHAIITVRRCGVMNMSELAEHLLVTRPQLTKIIDTLVETGYLAREINPDNRREVLLRITGQGQAFIEESLLGRHSLLARVLESAGEEEVEELRQAVRTLRRVFAKLESE